MQRPIVTGAKFGLGFAVVFVIVSFTAEYIGLLILDSLFPESSFGEPAVVRSEPVLRNGTIVVLATVRNPEEAPISFDAEAVVFDADDEFVDTCHTDRSFELAPSAELNFVASCSTLPVDGTAAPDLPARAALQFY